MARGGCDRELKASSSVVEACWMCWAGQIMLIRLLEECWVTCTCGTGHSGKFYDVANG